MNEYLRLFQVSDLPENFKSDVPPNKWIVGKPYSYEDRINDMLIHFSRRFPFTPEQIKSGQRDHEVVIWRSVIIYTIHKYLGMTYKTIGKIFNNRDHSSIRTIIMNVEYDLKYFQEHPNMPKTAEYHIYKFWSEEIGRFFLNLN